MQFKNYVIKQRTDLKLDLKKKKKYLTSKVMKHTRITLVKAQAQTSVG